jgi:hypothetical protein
MAPTTPSQVPEKELVRDGLRAAQGCSGTYCTFPAAPGGAAASPAAAAAAAAGVLRGGEGLRVAAYRDAGIGWPQRHVMHILGELGMLFR